MILRNFENTSDSNINKYENLLYKKAGIQITNNRYGTIF